MTIIFFVQEKVCKHTVTYLYPEVSERTCTGSWRMSDGIHCCRWWYTWRCHHANHSTQKHTHLQIHTFISKANWIFFVVIFLRHDLKKIYFTLPIKDNNKSAAFILISVCYVKENWYQTCLSKSIRVQRSPCVTRGHVGFKINDLTLITTPKLTAWSLPQYL